MYQTGGTKTKETGVTLVDLVRAQLSSCGFMLFVTGMHQLSSVCRLALVSRLNRNESKLSMSNSVQHGVPENMHAA